MRKLSALAVLLFSMPAVSAAPRDRHGDALPDGALMRLGTIQQRVAASQLALSADGRTLITVAAGRAIARWDAGSGKMRDYRLLPGEPTSSFWLSCDGRLLAVAEEKSLAVFDTETGACKHRLTASVQQVAFRPDGKALVTAESDKSSYRIRVWDLAASKDRLLAEVPSYVNAFCFRPDGKRLFVAASDSLRCWDMDSGKQVWQNYWRTHKLAVSQDGQTVCSYGISEKSLLYLFEAETGRRIRGDFRDRNSSSGSAAFAPDGRAVFQTNFKDVLLWDVGTGQARCRFAGAGSSFVVAPDGKTLVSLAGAQLRRWDVATGKPLYPDTSGDGHTGAVRGLVFTPDGRGIVTLGDDQTIRFCDLATQQLRILLTGICPRCRLHPRHFDNRASASPDSWRVISFPDQNLVVTADGRHLISDSPKRYLCLTDLRTGEEVRRFGVRNTHDMLRFGAVRLSTDGQTLWTLPYHSPSSADASRSGEEQQMLIGWDVSTCRQLSAQDVGWFDHCGEIVVAPDGRSVFLRDGSLRDAASRKERLIDAQGLSPPFAFSADSRLVAAADLRGGNRWDTLAVHELLTGRRLVRLKALISCSSRLAFSPDGRLLVVSGADALHVWEVSSGRRLLHLPAEGRLPAWLPGSFGTCLAVAPDGCSAATGHDDGTVLQWDLSSAWKRLADRPIVPLTLASFDDCWAELLKNDPCTAYSAMDRLTTAAALTLPFLRNHLRPVTIDSHWLQLRLADLDSSEFGVREEATRDLERVAEALQPRLRRELERTSSLEVRRRLRRLVEAIPTRTLSSEVVRRLRAVAVLEQIGGPEARRLLRELADGEEGDALSRAARSALTRTAATQAP